MSPHLQLYDKINLHFSLLFTINRYTLSQSFACFPRPFFIYNSCTSYFSQLFFVITYAHSLRFSFLFFFFFWLAIFHLCPGSLCLVTFRSTSGVVGNVGDAQSVSLRFRAHLSFLLSVFRPALTLFLSLQFAVPLRCRCRSGRTFVFLLLPPRLVYKFSSDSGEPLKRTVVSVCSHEVAQFDMCRLVEPPLRQIVRNAFLGFRAFTDGDSLSRIVDDVADLKFRRYVCCSLIMRSRGASWSCDGFSYRCSPSSVSYRIIPSL